MIKTIIAINIVFLLLGLGIFELSQYANIEYANPHETERMLTNSAPISADQLILMISRLYMRCQEARASALYNFIFGQILALVNLTFAIVMIVKNYKKKIN